MAYLGKIVLGNFKQLPGKIRARKSPRERREGMSREHLELIRKLPCCITGRVPGGEVHHLKSETKERGMGLRSTDKWGIPMSHAAHMEVEAVGTRNEKAWFLARGIDPHELARSLWASTGNLDRMRRVLMAHVEGRGR